MTRQLKTLYVATAALFAVSLSTAAGANDGVRAQDEIGSSYELIHGAATSAAPAAPAMAMAESGARTAWAFDEIGGAYPLLHTAAPAGTARTTVDVKSLHSFQAHDEIGASYRLAN